MMASIPILMYHQIDERPSRGKALRGLVVSPGTFKRQMALLDALGYQGLCMSALMPYLRGEKLGKVCGITFDDGYLNNLQVALPILLKHQFTATCYAVSGALGGSNTWDHQKGIDEKPLMDANQLRTWLASGQEVGAHGVAHLDLTSLSENQAAIEIRQSKLQLELMLNTTIQHFCYPYGRYFKEHLQMVENAGYQSATTTQRGRASLNDGIFALPRVQVMGSVWIGQFWQKLATTYEDRRR